MVEKIMKINSRDNPQYKKYSDNFKELIIGCYMEKRSLVKK